MLVLLLLISIGLASALYFSSRGYITYFGDAEAHLDIARRIVDSRTPGYEQIGTVWLPLPHLLMLPFVGSMRLWQTGLAGTIPATVCFVTAGLFLFLTSRLVLQSLPSGLATALVFALNPNLLYLSSAPMSEPVFFACISGLLYFSVRFARSKSMWAAGLAGLFSAAACLTRYDGWILIPFVTLYFVIAGGERRWSSAIFFGAIASVPALYWLGHNWVFYGDALEFYRGPYSNNSVNPPGYPGYRDWSKAWLYYRTAATLCVGVPLVWLGVFGIFASFARRVFWPVVFLAIGPAFYILSNYSAGTPIYVPELWTKSYYNTRYGLAVLPLLAFGAGALVSLVPRQMRAVTAGVAVAIATVPWVAYPGPQNWIVWKESEVNSAARRAWTHEAALYLRGHYRKGEGIVFSFGDLTGVLREAGIPLRESVHTGNNPEFDATIARPDLFLRYTWALAFAGDDVAKAVQRLRRDERPYLLVKKIVVQDAPVVEIYRRPPPIFRQ